jgi:hypothetical protein
MYKPTWCLGVHLFILFGIGQGMKRQFLQLKYQLLLVNHAKDNVHLQLEPIPSDFRNHSLAMVTVSGRVLSHHFGALLKLVYDRGYC